MAVQIEALRIFGEVEIVVIGAPFRSADGSWLIKLILRWRDSDRQSTAVVPMGALPLLSIGRVFISGNRSDLAWTGKVADITIPDVSACEEIESDAVPGELLAPLFSSARRRGPPQSVLLYRVGDRRIYVPAIELIRACHLTCSTLATAILRPQALMGLYRPLRPGAHERLRLDFTAALPVGLLRGKRAPGFVERFAWTAVHPEGRRSWDSVARLSPGSGSLRIAPPALIGSEWRVRMIEADNAALVLEIASITGKEQVAEEIVYTHPKLIRYVRTVTRTDVGTAATSRAENAGAKGETSTEPFDGEVSEEEGSSDAGEGGAERLIVETEAATRMADPSVVSIEGNAHEFDRTIPIRDIRFEVEATKGKRAKMIVTDDEDEDDDDGETGIRTVRRASGGALDGSQAAGSGDAGPRRTMSEAGETKPAPAKPAAMVRRKVTVAEPEPGAELDQIEFSTLEKMDTDYVGALGPLVEVLRRMDAMLPTVRVSSSLTPLPEGRAISRIGAARFDRRPALVAVLWPADRGPTLLIDVDHSGGVSVAMLALRYGPDATMAAIEEDVKAMLTALATNGFWVMETLQEQIDAGAVAVERLVKVLRRTRSAEHPDYINRWVLTLIERLGFQDEMRSGDAGL
ncbi:hypothetical protein [Rubrimonas cliftonensis]|uniref:TnsE C-terminal domain-containing protein n=1 Tax=Rubrimonas cliftonensis TaxID=89524 RepID=A0A1H4CTB4_9RHOB|nr:hypothetical protein [Rubrimonas cliftonensis]SEA63596.1 hypothetical protein SAMN05444370_10820 [Rubrimonas cliftonensis]